MTNEGDHLERRKNKENQVQFIIEPFGRFGENWFFGKKKLLSLDIEVNI